MTQEKAYIVAAARTPVGRAFKGAFRNTRPDDLLAHALRGVLAQTPSLDPAAIDDVLVGCAMPEAEQGMNVARIGALLAACPSVPACDRQPLLLVRPADHRHGRRPHPPRRRRRDDRRRHRVHEHDADDGHKPAMNPRTFTDDNVAIAYGMGITAEKVAEEWKVSREDQDQFAYRSHQKCHRRHRRRRHGSPRGHGHHTIMPVPQDGTVAGAPVHRRHG
jgi:acetyl-CoA acyltransferase